MQDVLRVVGLFFVGVLVLYSCALIVIYQLKPNNYNLREGTQAPAAFGEYPEIHKLQEPVARSQDLGSHLSEQFSVYIQKKKESPDELNAKIY